MKWADRRDRARVPDRRIVETPEGTLAIELDWLAVGGVHASMTLYGADGWKTDRRTWLENVSRKPGRDETGSLPQLITEWTGLSSAAAEDFVDETVARWRRSSAFERDVKIGRRSMRLIVVLAVVAVLALVGAAALVWLVVSALA